MNHKLLSRAAFAFLPVGALLLAPSAAFAQDQNAPPPAASKPCPGNSAGITLPDGFCASVFADHLGHVRHMVVGPNGVLYVNTWSGRYYGNDKPPPGGFLIALQDTKDDGHADVVKRFGPTAAEGNHGGTGIRLYNGALFAETNDKIVRYALPANGIVPTAAPETVVSGLPLSGDHPMHPFIIDPNGQLFVDLGSATNSCQQRNRTLRSPGIEPCIELKTRGGTWRYDANRNGQEFSPAERYASGIRNGEGFAFDDSGRLYVTQHGRDQLSQNWPNLYTTRQGAYLPAEELLLLDQGADYGWPECYFDNEQQKLVLAPEYGGDGGKTVGVCAQKRGPVAFFPAHWAPNDLAIYNGTGFPTAYRGGAFIAFHGSWNRAPLPQAGYNMVFQPLADGKPSGKFVVFADGFAGRFRDPARAAYRPTGLAVSPDGTLYISDDRVGRIWRVTYQGGNPGAAVQAASPPPASPRTATSTNPMPPEGLNAGAGAEANVASLPLPPGVGREEVARGARIFSGQLDDGTCAGCHGIGGKGSTIAPDLAEGHWQWSYGSLAGIERTIRQGVAEPKNYRSSMPPMGGTQMSNTDLNAVAAYVWSLGHQH